VNASERATGPAADLSKEITGGRGLFIGEATPADLTRSGYAEHEYVASGTATAYRTNGPLSRDGRFALLASGDAGYDTRVIVRRPANAVDFSGTVVVEWMNVSGGIDASPDFTSLAEELTRRGDVWVGVSAQLIGVEGGPVIVKTPRSGGIAGKGLKAIDPARYGNLNHPGDGYSFDIFTQVARALRKGGPEMGGIEPTLLLAAGESQSALALTTYYNGVQPLTQAFDGFLVHSRASVCFSLVEPADHADIASSLGSNTAVTFRTDLDTPVLNLQAETDVTGIFRSADARQPDSDRFRLWEVAGTAHADLHLLGPTADLIDCGAPINNGPMHLVAKAALNSLDKWVRTGNAPPSASPIEVTQASTPAIRRDSDGIALGGVRTPLVDVPVDVLSGEPGPNPDLLCLLLGSTKPLPPERIAELYPSRAAYQQRFSAEADKVIGAGFVLEADREELLAFAQPSRIRA
jgi:hypothetical protein